MSLTHNEKNAAGYRYDETGRFRFVVRITKGDLRAELFERLYQGTGVAYPTLEAAMRSQQEYHRLLTLIGKLPGDFASYGLSCIIDERDGTVNNVLHIG